MCYNIPVTIQATNHPFPSKKQHCQNPGPHNGTKQNMAKYLMKGCTETKSDKLEAEPNPGNRSKRAHGIPLFNKETR